MKYLHIKCLLILLLVSCEFINNRNNITEKQLINYIKTYKELRTSAPELLESLNINPENYQKSKLLTNDVEKMVVNQGFKSFSEFIVINAKVGIIFSLIQANKGIDNFKNLHENSLEMIDQGIAEYQKLIDDPEIPEENKDDYKNAMQELMESKNEITKNASTDQKIADAVLDKAQKISGLIVSEKDIELINKFENEIMAAYAGFPVPELSDGKFPDISLK